MPETFYQYLSKKDLQNINGYSISCNELCLLTSVSKRDFV